MKPNLDFSMPFVANTWNDYEITAQGQNYTVKLNGVVINKFTGDRSTSGYIAIQSFNDHLNDFRFRNVRIQDLSVSKTRSFTDTNGRVVEATVLQVKDDHVTLHVPASGQKFVFPFSKFCAADIAYLKGLVTADEVAASASPIDVKLDYIGEGAQVKVQGFRPHRVVTSTQAPASIRKAPGWIANGKFGDQMTRYGEIKMGAPGSERTHALIWDRPLTKTSRLAVDRHANGDLTDDPYIRWQLRPLQGASSSKELGYRGEFRLDVNLAYPANFQAYTLERNDPNQDPNAFNTELVIFSDYMRSGTVTINGKLVPAVLTDDECKGDFSAPTNLLHLDLSGDGRFDPKTEEFMIKDAYKINGTTYEVVGITPSGASFQLVKSSRTAAK